MRESDFSEFSEMLDAVCGLLSRGAYRPNATNTALWFRALAAHPLATVRAGFDAHVTDPDRGRFVPTPADILAKIQGAEQDDGRPGPEEAWAISIAANDEQQTLVWTEEMAQAWGVAAPVLQAGDEVGARMAFREAYNRIVESARRARQPVVWSASLGLDKDRRLGPLNAAVEAGRLKASDLPALPPPAGTPLLGWDEPKGMPPHIRERLLKLREQLTGGVR